MRLLILDSGSLSLDLLRYHLEPCFGPDLQVHVVESVDEVINGHVSLDAIDAIVAGATEDFPGSRARLDGLIARAVGMPIVLVHPRYHTPLLPGKPEHCPVRLLPEHQLARLPSLLEKVDVHATRLDIDLSGLSADLHAGFDPYWIIASLTSDDIYIIDLAPDGTTLRRQRSDALSRLAGTGRVMTPYDILHEDDHDLMTERMAALRAGKPRIDEYRIRTSDGRIHWLRDHGQPIPSEDGSYIEHIVGTARDVTEEKLVKERLTSQATILEMITRGADTESVLATISSLVEKQLPEAMCSIHLVDDSGTVLRQHASMKLPPEYVEATRIVPIAPNEGACGSAAHFGQLMILRDMLNDPRCQKYAHLGRQYGLRAIWSNPIYSSHGSVLGTFAIYHREVRDPQDQELAMLEVAAHLAGIAIEKDQRENDLRMAEVQYRTLVEQTPVTTYIAEPDDLFDLRYVSPQLAQSIEAPLDSLLHVPELIVEWIHENDRAEVVRRARHSIETDEEFRAEFRVCAKSDHVLWMQSRAILIRDRNDAPSHWQGVLLDVTERSEATRLLTESERRYRSLFEDNLNIVFTYDREGRILSVNPAAERISGYTRDELVGRPFSEILAPGEYERARRYFYLALHGIPQQLELTVRGKRGDSIDLNISKSPLYSNGAIIGVSGIAEDITERKRLEAELRYRAYHDTLTGLPNRSSFYRELKSACNRMDANTALAVLYLDLNNFKVINDSLGHEVGDRYLTGVARRLGEIAPRGSIVARFGGDEFTILLPPTRNARDRASSVAEEIISALSHSLSVDGYSLGTNVSIGIAVSAGQVIDDPRELVRRADIALYDAKRRGRESRYSVFHSGMDEWVFERLWIERDLREAVAEEQFVVYFQPLRSLRADMPQVVEALVRWRHPTRGLLLPGEFLRIAEETGHIFAIDGFVLRTACEQVSEWNRQRADNPPIHLSVNISAREFWHEGFSDNLLATFEQTGFDPHWLRVEITESTMMQDTALASSVIQELRARGVRFAIDDFGTGYSSLSSLRQFPVDVLKIDRSFIGEIDESREQRNLVSAIVAIARALDLEVVAEGLETPGQLQAVTELGCDYAQGYVIARPEPFDQLPVVFDEAQSGSRSR